MEYRMGCQAKGQSERPCPSVYSPATALRSLSSVALSSAQAGETLSLMSTAAKIYTQISPNFSSTFLDEATNHLSSTFLREATGERRGEVSLVRSQDVGGSRINA